MLIRPDMVYRQKGHILIPFIIMDIDRLIGGNLKRLRLMAGLTQEALAEKLGIQSTGLIPRWEAGTKGIGKDVLTRLCKVFAVKIAEFYREEDTPMITDREEMRIITAIRKYPEIKPEMFVIAESLANYKGKSTPTKKKRKAAA